MTGTLCEPKVHKPFANPGAGGCRAPWKRVLASGGQERFAYFTENLQTYSPFSYFDILSRRGSFRHAISLRARTISIACKKRLPGEKELGDQVTSH